jgi:hypothetical protein
MACSLLTVVVQEPGGQLGQGRDVAVLGDAGRMLAEDVAGQPVVGGRGDQHGRQGRPVPGGYPRSGLAGEPFGDDPVDTPDLPVAHLGQQVGEAGQVADHQPGQVTFLVQAPQPGPGDHRQPLGQRQGGEAGRVGDEAQQLFARGDLLADPLGQQGVLGGEVPVQAARAGGQASGRLDLGDRGCGIALLAEQAHRLVEDALAGRACGVVGQWTPCK